MIDYSYDHGGLGYGAGGTAIVPANSIGGNLRRFLIPPQYQPIRWENDGSLCVRVNYVECLRNNEVVSKASDSIQGTRINIEIHDETVANHRLVEADLPSPSRELRLVAYRYPDGPNLGRIHLSIIHAAEAIPKYGNFYIASLYGDGVLDARWDSETRITFFTTTSQRYVLDDAKGFRQGRPSIAFDIREDDKLQGYLWRRKP